MGCGCSKPLDDAAEGARSAPHGGGPGAAAAHSAPAVLLQAHGGGGGSGLSHSQRKQLRAMARSALNPHQLQALQLLHGQQPAHVHELPVYLQRPPSGPAAAALAARGDSGSPGGRRRHHHHHPQLLQQERELEQRRPRHHPHNSGRAAAAFPGLPAADAWPAAEPRPAAAAAVSQAPADALSPEQVLALCGAVADEQPQFAAAGVTPLTLAALCLVESGGCPSARQMRDHVGEEARGLFQMLPSTAQWLAGRGHDRYGPSPSAAVLQRPKASAYFAGAYLCSLCAHTAGAPTAAAGGPRGEAFAVRAFHLGPKGVGCPEGEQYWQKFLKARHWLREAARAMAATLAAAAAAAGGAPPSPPPEGGGAAVQQQQQQQQQRSRLWRSGAPEPGGGTQQQQQPQQQQDVWVWARAAPLIEALSSSWDDSDGSDSDRSSGTGHPQGSPATPAAASARLLSHLLPGLWQQQQQHRRQVAQQDRQPGRSPRRRWPGATAAAAVEAGAVAGAGSALARVPVPRAALSAALRRAAAVAGDARGSPAPAGPGGGPGAPPAAPPCVMHVVGSGETLEQIASVCGVAVCDLLAANPELPGGAALQPNDVIALPVPVVPPRLYVVRPGDTLHGIARGHCVALGRLLSLNPELADPSRVQAGWLVVLPGLGGGSKGAPLAWLADAALGGGGGGGGEPGASGGAPQQAEGDALCGGGPDQGASPASGALRGRPAQLEAPAAAGCGGRGKPAGAARAARGPPAGSPPVGSGAFMFSVGGAPSWRAPAPATPAVRGLPAFVGQA